MARRAYKFNPAKAEIPEVSDLSNAERRILQKMAEPGGPLWKIMRTMDQYAEDLKMNLLTADLNKAEDLAALRTIQATAVACLWVRETFEAAMTLEEEEEQAK